MMGGGPAKDKKFIQKIMRQLRDGKTELSIVDDKLGTPTYTRDFAHNVRLLLESECWGLYNMVCQGATSRLEVAEELVEELGLGDAVTVTPVGLRLLRRDLLRATARLRAADQPQARAARARRDAAVARGARRLPAARLRGLPR